MSDDYLWVWADRRRRVTVLKVRGELDASTADRFVADAAGELRQLPGPIAVDLSLLDFLDCAGAHALAAVVHGVSPWRLTEVRGIRPPVARLLELAGIDLPVPPGRDDLVLSPRGQELLARARDTRMQSLEVLLESGAVMARLAATYSDLAAATQRWAEREQATAAYLRTLSDTARGLSARLRESALCGPAADRWPPQALPSLSGAGRR